MRDIHKSNRIVTRSRLLEPDVEANADGKHEDNRDGNDGINGTAGFLGHIVTGVIPSPSATLGINSTRNPVNG